MSNDPDESPYEFAIKGEIKGYEITGQIQYDTTAPKPVRGALVRAWDDDGIVLDTFMGEAYTDDNGNFKIVTTHAATDVYFRESLKGTLGNR